MSEAAYPNISGALIKAQLEIPVLRKDERNAHGGYNYVPIDGFYEAIAPVVAKHGLTWKIREDYNKIIEIPGKNGNLVGAMQARYIVDMIHESGEVWENFFQATILHPLQGAQTAGSAMSYLDKLFLRTTFHIVTGEADADASDNSIFSSEQPVRSSRPPKPPVTVEMPSILDAPEPAQPSLAEADLLRLSGEMLPLATSDQELTKFWNDNEAAFNSLKKSAPEDYKILVGKFKTRKQELKGANA